MVEIKEMTTRVVGRPLQTQLPEPATKGRVSLEESISRRESVREFLKSKPISLRELSQILWAAQGITHQGLRSAPSAGALYPIEIYVVVREHGVEGLLAGVHHYDVQTHTLALVREGDVSSDLQSATMGEEAVRLASISIVITAIFERTTGRYGERGVQYVFQESGHISQNIFLQATALGLSTFAMGAFLENEVKKVICASRNQRPIYVQPIGIAKKRQNG